MRIKFEESVVGQDYRYEKGQVIDGNERPADQLKRWLARGVVVAAEEPPQQATEQPPSTATAADYERPTLPYRNLKKNKRR